MLVAVYYSNLTNDTLTQKLIIPSKGNNFGLEVETGYYNSQSSLTPDYFTTAYNFFDKNIDLHRKFLVANQYELIGYYNE